MNRGYGDRDVERLPPGIKALGASGAYGWKPQERGDEIPRGWVIDANSSEADRARGQGMTVVRKLTLGEEADSSGNLGPRRGRVVDPESGRIVSARLNPDLADKPEDVSIALGVVLASAPLPFGVVPTAKMIDQLLKEVDPEYRDPPAPAGGKRGYRGGVVSSELAEAFLDLLGEDRVAFGKAVVLWVASTTKQMARDTAAAAIGPTLEYLKSRVGERLGGTSGKVLAIALKLADNIVQTPVTAIELSVAGAGFTLNFASYVIGEVNKVGRTAVDYLLSEDTAKNAADAATDSIKSWTTTAAVGVVVLNQMGVLPLSAILAAIIVTIQAQVGTGGGRAYLVAGFYAWYNTQSEDEQNKIKKAATTYAAAAADAAKTGAKVAGPPLKAAAAKAAATLTRAAAALAKRLQVKKGGKNAVQAMATGEGASAEQAAPAGQAGIPDEEGIAAALQKEPAVKAAALAASVAEEAVPAAEEAVPPGPRTRARAKAPVGDEAMAAVGGRRKTKKQKSKRRVTRRRKATKVLTTPTFVY